MAESLMHELNTQFNDMGLNAKKKKRSTNKNTKKKNKHLNMQEHCMPYQAFTDSQDITYVCSSCGGNLYSDIIKEDPFNETLYYKLICPRGCVEQPAEQFDIQQQYQQPPNGPVHLPNYQPHINGNFHNYNMPMNAGYMPNYNPYNDMAAMNTGCMPNYNPYNPPMQNNDYKFNATAELASARAARLNQLLKAVDCDNCHPMTIKERTNRFEAFKRKNVRRAEYQLQGAKNYGEEGASSTPEHSSDLSSMAEGMFEYTERIRRFYEHTQYNPGCGKCGGMQ